MRGWLFMMVRRLNGRYFSYLFSWILTYMSFLIPTERLYETDTLVAFYHPQPSYAVHILLVPKRPLPNLMALTPADHAFMQDVFTTTQRLVKQLELPAYRLINNGGAYQDIPHLHFHLVSGSSNH